MEARKKLFGKHLGLNTIQDRSHLERVLKCKHPESATCALDIEYCPREFDGIPEGTVMPSPALFHTEDWMKTHFDPSTPSGEVTGKWVSSRATSNFIVLSLFEQGGSPCSREVTWIHPSFHEQAVNSRMLVDYGRVDRTMFCSHDGCYSREDGLLPVALGLVPGAGFSSTSAMIFPYKSSFSGRLPTCAFDQPENSVVKVTLHDIETCWKQLVSNNTNIQTLLENHFHNSQLTMSEHTKTSLAINVLLNGVYLRFEGLQHPKSWAKLLHRLFHVGGIKETWDVLPQDLDCFQAREDLCHVTHLLFGLVVTKCRFALVDGNLRTLVARLVPTFRCPDQTNGSSYQPLKYSPESLYLAGLEGVAREETIEVINIEGDEALSPKHLDLLRARSFELNRDSETSTSRGIIENLAAFVSLCSRGDHSNPQLTELFEYNGELSLKNLNDRFKEQRKTAIQFLLENPDTHTHSCLNNCNGHTNDTTDPVNSWQDRFMNREQLSNLQNLENKFPMFPRGVNFFCTMLMACMSSGDPGAILATFIRLNGLGRLHILEGRKSFKVSVKEYKHQ
jgi:hypothetical protein